jgi:tRNA(adenine34) deaminase
MLSVQSDDYFMDQAIKEAQVALENGEVPIGACIVHNNRIIAKAHNQTEQLNDVTAHAEMLAITSAATFIGAKYLTDCTVYVTVEPCPMCAAALNWAQVKKVVYGTEDEKSGFMKFGREMLHPKTTISMGVKQEVCKKLMQDFFKTLR